MGSNKNARLFIGNLTLNADQKCLKERFEKYGVVKDLSLHRGFAFVRFENEESAKEALEKENGADFMGKNLNIQPPKDGNDGKESIDGPAIQKGHTFSEGNRGRGSSSNARGGRNLNRDVQRRDGGYGGPPQFYGGPNNHRNDPGFYPPQNRPFPNENFDRRPPVRMDTRQRPYDCEILYNDVSVIGYAENVARRLRNLDLDVTVSKVEILPQHPEDLSWKIIDRITERGVLYAVTVDSRNAEFRSLTLNLLQGSATTYRNMPLEDAIPAVEKDFVANHRPGGKSSVSKNTLPDDIHNILGFVIDGRPMSTVEYDKLIKYFAKRRENALREEYGDNIPPSLANPPLGPPIDPKVKAAQDALHDRILRILDRPPVPKPSSIPASSSQDSIQKALDALVTAGPNLFNQLNKSQGNNKNSLDNKGFAAFKST